MLRLVLVTLVSIARGAALLFTLLTLLVYLSTRFLSGTHSFNVVS
jgi:hypothetical protein